VSVRSASLGALLANAGRGEDNMPFTISGLLVLLIVAGVCGSIGRAIGGGTDRGFIVSIAVGFVGALLGALIARPMRLPELFDLTVDRHPFPIMWSLIGAALFVALTHLISGRTLRV
jgi:uncharacterized membrane protein YeaQ/YmgE (transglycosylase-associated protein family)